MTLRPINIIMKINPLSTIHASRMVNAIFINWMLHLYNLKEYSVFSVPRSVLKHWTPLTHLHPNNGKDILSFIRRCLFFFLYRDNDIDTWAHFNSGIPLFIANWMSKFACNFLLFDSDNCYRITESNRSMFCRLNSFLMFIESNYMTFMIWCYWEVFSTFILIAILIVRSVCVIISICKIGWHRRRTT